ncbi:MAG: aminotransferase class III-fold pyridoxal phosphate-dependent enzyme [Planctomycetes bacterium]|nr:aminotransferase class III-fold pyridoxal phosphate-dependent enzyme [Planctomycetota bacterium]
MSDPISALPSPLAADPEVARAVDAIVARVRAAQASITGARPADPARKAAFDAAMQRTVEARGRGPILPYLGSGMGNGPLVELLDGSVKWDMINGIGVHMFGHGDPRMVAAAVRAGLSDLCMQGNLASNQDSVAFAEFLVAEARRSSRIAHCFVTNSGCMANESALKVCMQKTGGAPRIIAFEGCFVGRSVTMSQIGDTSAYRQGVPLSTLVDYMPFYDPLMGPRSIEMAVWHLKQYIHRYPGQHACFVMELVQGEGGFNTAPREFFVALMETCKAAGIPVWDDEVQSFGRTTSMFAFEALGLGQHVDVVTVGKMTQACACLFVADMNPKPGLLSGTFTASTSAFQVGLEALRTLHGGGYYGPEGRNARLHAEFRRQAEALVAKHPDRFPEVRDQFGRPGVAKVGGVGGMCRLTPFGGEKERVLKFQADLFAEGVMTFYCGHGPYHLRMLPPIGVMQPEHWGPVFEIIERALLK